MLAEPYSDVAIITYLDGRGIDTSAHAVGRARRGGTSFPLSKHVLHSACRASLSVDTEIEHRKRPLSHIVPVCTLQFDDGLL